jgi:hypothetical protein
MLPTLLKIALAVAVPVGTVCVTRQYRHRHDVQLVREIVGRPCNVQLALTDPGQSLERNRQEVQLMRQLIQDLER